MCLLLSCLGVWLRGRTHKVFVFSHYVVVVLARAECNLVEQLHRFRLKFISGEIGPLAVLSNANERASEQPDSKTKSI